MTIRAKKFTDFQNSQGEVYFHVITHGLQPTRLLCSWDSPGKKTGVGCHFLLQGIFPTQKSNPHFLLWQMDSLPLHHLSSSPHKNTLRSILLLAPLYTAGKLRLRTIKQVSPGVERFCSPSWRTIPLPEAPEHSHSRAVCPSRGWALPSVKWGRQYPPPTPHRRGCYEDLSFSTCP